MSSLPTVSVREWTDVVRRAQLGRTTKYVALMLATYADYANGRRAYPGLARLCVACELSYNTVKAALRALREAGLVELVAAANSRGQADEYRLILAEDVLERIAVATPAAMDVEIERLRQSRRGVYSPRLPEDLRTTGRTAETDLRTSARTAENPETADLRTSAWPADPKPADQMTTRRSESADQMTNSLRTSARPPTTHLPNTLTTSHYDEELRTAVTHTRAREADQDPNSSLPERCPHGLASRLRADGKPSCAICRRDADKPTAAVIQLRPRPEAS